ncbi:MAG: D-ribose pyranase [Chloroflexi bacterium]|nr:D-ribose pyranase [Chloroflexota bacterium]
MKKNGILNKEISDVVAGMGHYQSLVICDAGFPIPPEVRRIDLALEPGLPAFMDVLRVVLKELQVEEIIIASETSDQSPARYQEMIALFPGVISKVVPHTEFKKLSYNAKACIRSGECTPYSNLILVSGVTY